MTTLTRRCFCDTICSDALLALVLEQNAWRIETKPDGDTTLRLAVKQISIADVTHLTERENVPRSVHTLGPRTAVTRK